MDLKNKDSFLEALDKMMEEGYVNKQKHPVEDIFIYNYSQKTQFERVWNDVTLQCRGLILDNQQNIVARPLKKFFNLEELESSQIPDEAFEVYEKMDGSLGILYFIGNQPKIATRGSFISPQSQKATAMLHEKYETAIPKLNKSYTYLFEIIYPENRIVVDYGSEEKMVLLAIIDKENGQDIELSNIGFPVVKRYSGAKDWSKLKDLEEDNREGFIVKFKNGFRMKVKFEEYKRLHKILTNVSNVSIWEYLSTEMPFEEILERVPDEFYDWVKSTKQKLLNDYKEVEDLCKHEFKDLGNRKLNALYYKNCKYPSILFKMLDDKNYTDIIWKLVRPTYQKPFSDKTQTSEL